MTLLEKRERICLMILAVGQMLFTAAFSVDLTLTGVVGYVLADNKSIATLPYSLITLTACFVTLFASLFMGRFGRRGGFLLGSLFGITGGIISFWAIETRSFSAFCLGTACVGVFQAFAQYYRLAAADDVPDSRRARNISIVLSGGVLASILGPLLAYEGSKFFKACPYAGAYLIVALLGCTSLVLMYFLPSGNRKVSAKALSPSGSRILNALTPVARRQYVTAVVNNCVSYSTMMVLMSIAPIYLLQRGYGVTQASEIMMLHLFAMFASSPFSGWICARIGCLPTMGVGIIILGIVCTLNLFFQTLPFLFLALFLLGLCWNLMFVAGSALLTKAVPEAGARAYAQGMSEFATTLMTAISCFLGGWGLTRFGWNVVNDAVVAVAFLFMIFLVVNVVGKFFTMEIMDDPDLS